MSNIPLTSNVLHIAHGSLKRPLNVCDEETYMKKKMQRIVSTPQDDRAAAPDGCHPHDFLIKILATKGVKVSDCSFESLVNFFHDPSEEEVENYKLDILNAVRGNDLATLREFCSQGRSLKCSNRFGESILHLACRKQLIDIVDFLVNEAGIPVKVCDDFGRTPLHDACWTHKPDFKLVDLILSKCPDLLYIRDKRGHTPLYYARKDHWCIWIEHLQQQTELLIPKEIIGRNNYAHMRN